MSLCHLCRRGVSAPNTLYTYKIQIYKIKNTQTHDDKGDKAKTHNKKKKKKYMYIYT